MRLFICGPVRRGECEITLFRHSGARQEAHPGMTKPWIASEKIEKYKLKTWAEQNRVARWDREAIGLKLDR